MRWFWIDRFLEFKSGRRAVTMKNISLAEEQLDGYLPAMSMMPPTLIIEGLAQTGGLLVGEASQFEERVVLAKVNRARFHFFPKHGDTLTYTAEIEDIRDGGAICNGTSYRGEELQAEMELVFAFLEGERFVGVDMFDPGDFMRMLRLFGLYDVGRGDDGNPLPIPPRLLAAEMA